MKGKNTIRTLLITTLLLISGLGIFYSQFVSAFNQHNLKAMHIRLVQDNASEDVADEYFILSVGEKSQLAQALASVTGGEIEPDKVSYQYNLVLRNRWGLSKEYTILFTESAVYLRQQQSTAKLGQPGFFYSHPGFYHIYSDRIMPPLQVIFNENEAPSAIDIQWSYLRHDGQWDTQKHLLNKEFSDKGEVTVVSGDDRLRIATDKAPSHAQLKILELASDRVVFHGEADDLSQLPLPEKNGSYRYYVTLEWLDEIKPYKGQASVVIPVVIDFPEKFVFSKVRIVQGDLLQVSLYHAKDIEDIFFEQSMYGKFRWYPQDDGVIRGYIPTNYNTRPGTYQIKYGNRKKGTELTQEIEVVPHSYRIQHLTVDQEIEQSTRNEAAYAEFAKYFTPVRQQSAPQRYYSEPFILPTTGRLTTEFGQTRYVNGSPTSSRHSGLDIAAPIGTAVRAANRGKVVLAMSLILTGNTIVVDHGEGLFSVYYHMHKNMVSAGQMVERGQKIATVGTTGFSTGPHLHFTMSYYTNNLEPGFFIVGQPITVDNYRKFMQN